MGKIALVFLLGMPTALAEEALSDVDQKALEQTMQRLQNKFERQQYIEKNKKAKKADEMVDELFEGEEQKEQLYKLASKIFESSIKKEKGDGDALQKRLNKGAKDPDAFMRSLSSEEQAQIKALAEKLKEGKSLPRN